MIIMAVAGRMGKGVVSLAPAKLNITLEIKGREEATGLHFISSVMQTVSLYDYITVVPVEKGHESVEGSFISDNLIQNTIEELSKEAGKTMSCRVVCHKVIPVSAGMGGGSSDAAAVLRALNKMYDLQFSSEALERVARRLGNDVPFLLYGGRARVDGASVHKITAMDAPDLFYVIARPERYLGTKEMYAEHDKTGKSFLEMASERCPEITQLLGSLRPGAVECGMTGKGPTVFAGFKGYKECETACRSLSWFGGSLFIARSLKGNEEQYIEAGL
jgi:4-diphosphocytidyl-2C-methyl-D-erythritol kinase